MVTVQLRFYEELNDFLPPTRRKTTFSRTYYLPTTVKDLIEACGVPHTEVDLILVNGRSVGFDYRIRDGDKISVYPVFESFDISGVTRLQERPLRDLRFIADNHLGKLVRILRLLGLDVFYDPDLRGLKLISHATTTHRILLTRNRQLLMHNAVQRGYCVRSDQPEEQAVEVVKRFDLADSLQPFTRCTVCNEPVEKVPKEVVSDRLPPLTRKYYDAFHRCTGCGKVYWQGGHLKNLSRLVAQLRNRFVAESVR
jgi:hypothetical protein